MILQETPDEQAFNATHYYAHPCQVPPCGARWAIWPMSIVVDPVTTEALVFYSLVSVAGPGFDFQGVGTSVAIWRRFADIPQRPTLSPPFVVDHPDLLFNEREPTFGSAALINDGVLYAYGCGSNFDGLDKGCRLGKVSVATVQRRLTWTFYAGHGRWSPSVADAISVFEGNDILSVAWNSYLQRFVAIYSQPFSQDVMLRTSPAPEGPWSSPLPAFMAMQPANGNTYDAHAHPEFDSGQETYVTYSRKLTSGHSEVRLVVLYLRKGPDPLP